MRLRNRRALQDKTPRNSPQPAKLRSPASKQAFSAKRIPTPKFSGSQLVTPVEDADIRTPGTPGGHLLDSELLDREFSLSPSAAASARKAKRMPVHSTPIVKPRSKPIQRLAPMHSPAVARTAAAPPTPKRDRASSPLPPSSPPSDFDFTQRRRSVIPAILPAAEEDDEERSPLKLKVYRDPEPVEEEPAPVVQRQPSSDDPFGFLAVERKLKAQRAARKHPHRVPAPALEFQVLARDSSEGPFVPLRSDDDDLYLTVDPEAPESNKENVPLPLYSEESLQKVEEQVEEEGEEEEDEEEKADKFDYVLSSEMHPRQPDDEEQDALVPNVDDDEDEGGSSQVRRARSSTDDSYDPLRTPRHAHVSKDIFPIRSPFASHSTPCDRDLAIDSAPSSPSPTKPLQVVTPLQASSVRPMKKLGELLRQSQEKAQGKRRAAEVISGSSGKKPRITHRDTDAEEDPTSAGPASETPLKRTLRRSARSAAPDAAAGPSNSPLRRPTRAATKRTTVAVESNDAGDDADEEDLEESEDQAETPGKGKARARATPAPRTVKAESRTGTASRRGRRSATAAAKPTRMSAKAKGKMKAGEIEAEEEEAAKARKARVEYFRKLDSDYIRRIMVLRLSVAHWFNDLPSRNCFYVYATLPFVIDLWWPDNAADNHSFRSATV
ncbi:hypothetical protein EIP91_001066 [Steccherinum ochraceum]|uniref:Uncharacterized protein n=1 Tax=Steccherinum ochraceum TaxID=92696 RepID=A0A4R0RS88_9APHY|nr:hypothetical protein EIP91_001066 [Steccherinum ochraceum]